ncbi:type VI secretion protein [Escherichia coli]|nr:type VI secretion protein [Escherichia coli]EHK9946883.1 type VI secretion protein [Escherichia coli]KOA21680.1 type VI secretion protein [Escherichia coli]MBZ8707111.1 type VI secretion protein [Escherichia coli]
MGGVMTTAFSNAVSKVFVKVTIDNKIIKGDSKVNNCNDYFDAYCPSAFRAFAGIDGAVFDICTMTLKVNKQTQDLIEHFFKRGEKLVTIEVLRRESTKSGSEYSSFKVTYDGCRLHDILLAHDNDTDLILELSFSPEDSVSIEMNIPSSDGKTTEKLGPIKYSLQKQILI